MTRLSQMPWDAELTRQWEPEIKAKNKYVSYVQKTKCIQKSNFLVCIFFMICNKFELFKFLKVMREHT